MERVDKTWTSAAHLPTPCPHSALSRPHPHRFCNDDSSQRRRPRPRPLLGLLRHPKQFVYETNRRIAVGIPRDIERNNSSLEMSGRRLIQRNRILQPDRAGSHNIAKTDSATTSPSTRRHGCATVASATPSRRGHTGPFACARRAPVPFRPRRPRRILRPHIAARIAAAWDRSRPVVPSFATLVLPVPARRCKRPADEQPTPSPPRRG